jgi:competence protein ComEA
VTGATVVAGGAAPVQISPATAGPSTAAGVVVVHVVGRVRRPGLVRLAVGSRVSDAVIAAAGATAGARLDRLNLARPVTDGEQILVPGAQDPVPVGGAGTAGSAGAAGGSSAPAGAAVDLNTATSADLDGLPGVGPVLAGRILAWRAQHGRFSRVAELGEVPGIGDKLLAQLTPLVRV